MNDKNIDKKISIGNRKHYKHRMANPKVGWTKTYQEAWEEIFETDKEISDEKKT